MSHRSAMPLSQSEATERLFHRSHRFILLDDSHLDDCFIILFISHRFHKSHRSILHFQSMSRRRFSSTARRGKSNRRMNLWSPYGLKIKTKIYKKISLLCHTDLTDHTDSFFQSLRFVKASRARAECGARPNLNRIKPWLISVISVLSV